MSASGRELLPHIIGELDTVDRLRTAADEQHHISRMVRLGSANAATVPLFIPVIHDSLWSGGAPSSTGRSPVTPHGSC